MKVIIIAIRYLEPSWNETLKCIQESGLPYVIIDRLDQGTGSLAEAINRGVRSIGGFDWAWIVTNITFDPVKGKQFCYSAMDIGDFKGYAAVHPEFASDHPFLQIGSDKGVVEVPYVEFTAAMVRLDIMKQFPLDESMKYWGHDLDWGHVIRNKGMKVACSHAFSVDHIYIRYSKPHPITAKRHMMRKATDNHTRASLTRKYGPNWKKLLHYDGWN